MPRIFFALVFLFITAGCTHKLETKSGYQPGQYAVKQFKINPFDEELAVDPEYLEAKEKLSRAFAWEILGQGRKPEAELTMTILDVSFDINTARAVLVGDSYRISATVVLHDLKTQRLIAKDIVSATVNSQAGLLGVTVDAASSANTKEQYKRELVSQFTQSVIKLLYPNGWK